MCSLHGVNIINNKIEKYINMKTNIVKRTNVTKQRQPIKNRLQKYALGSQSLAVLSGVLGQTAICSAVLQNLDVSGIFNQTSVGGGGGTLGTTYSLYLTQSSDVNDRLIFNGNTFTLGDRVMVQGYNGARVFNSNNTLRYYPVGSSVTGNGSSSGNGYLTYAINVFPWVTDRLNGAIGFKNGDGELGFLNVSWVAATKTLTYLNGFFDDDSGVTSITVTAVPEPSEYAAALGLGAIGLAYYRRRPGSKSRPKNN